MCASNLMCSGSLFLLLGQSRDWPLISTMSASSGKSLATINSVTCRMLVLICGELALMLCFCGTNAQFQLCSRAGERRFVLSLAHCLRSCYGLTLAFARNYFVEFRIK